MFKEFCIATQLKICKIYFNILILYTEIIVFWVKIITDFLKIINPPRLRLYFGVRGERGRDLLGDDDPDV